MIKVHLTEVRSQTNIGQNDYVDNTKRSSAGANTLNQPSIDDQVRVHGGDSIEHNPDSQGNKNYPTNEGQELMQSISSINVRVVTHNHPPQQLYYQSQGGQNQLRGGVNVISHNNKDLKSVASSLRQESSRQQLIGMGSGDLLIIEKKQQSINPKLGKHKGSKKSRETSLQNHDQLDGFGEGMLVGHASLNAKQSATIKEYRTGGSRRSSLGGQQQQQQKAGLKSPLEPNMSKEASSKFQSLRIEGDKVAMFEGFQSHHTVSNQGSSKGNQQLTFGKSKKVYNASNVSSGAKFNNTPKFEGISGTLLQRTQPLLSSDQVSSPVQTDNPDSSMAQPFEEQLLLPVVAETVGTLEEVIPTISVSRRYMNANNIDDDNVIVEHSYSSSIKNRNLGQLQQSSTTTQNIDDKNNFGIGVESLDFRDPLKQVEQSLLNTNAPDVKRTPNAQHFWPSQPQPQQMKESEKVILVQDGDWTYEISGRDLAYFRRIREQQKKEQKKEAQQEQLTGLSKYVLTEKRLGHVYPNIRPGTTGSLLRKLDIKEKQRKDQLNVLQRFFEMLKQQGKARVVRDGDEIKRPSSVVYPRDVIYTSNQVANSILHQGSTEVENLATHCDDLKVVERPINSIEQQLKPAKPIFGFNSPKTIFKGINQNSIYQASEDFLMMLGNPIAVDSNHSVKNIIYRPHSQQDSVSRQGPNKTFNSTLNNNFNNTGVAANQENIGDTRNMVGAKSVSTGVHLRVQHAMRGSNQLFKSDERPSSEEGGFQRPGGRSGRRLVNINPAVAGSVSRHVRQNQQMSSYVESSKAPQMQPLLHDELMQNDLMASQVHNDLQPPRVFSDDADAQAAFNERASDNMSHSNVMQSPALTPAAELNMDIAHHTKSNQKKASVFYTPQMQMQTVKIQEFKLQIESPKLEQQMRPGSTKGVRDESSGYASSGGGKFSNSHIKKMFFQQSSNRKNTQAKNSLDQSSKLKSRRSSKQRRERKTERASSNDVVMTIKSGDANARILNIDSIKRDGSGSRQTGMPVGQAHLNKKFYDTPYFGARDSYDLPTFNEAGLANVLDSRQEKNARNDQMLQCPADQMDSNGLIHSSGEALKMNVLLSKSPMTLHETIQSQEVMNSDVAACSITEEEEAAAPGSAGGDAHLEHIIEETCESLDSAGLAESVHTMKSNFNNRVQTHVKTSKSKKKQVIKINRKASQVQIDQLNRNQSAMVLPENVTYAPLSERRTIEEGSKNDNDLILAKNKIANKRRSISPINNIRHKRLSQDIQVQNQMMSQQELARANVMPHSSSQEPRRNFEHLMSEHENEGLMQAHQQNAVSFKANTGGAMRVISKLGGSSIQQIPLQVMQGGQRAHRQPNEQFTTTGDPTRGTFPIVSSHGELDAQPRYEDSDFHLSHRHRSKEALLKRLPQDSRQSGVNEDPHYMKRIDMPIVEQIKTHATSFMGTAKNQDFFNSNSKVIVKYQNGSNYDQMEANKKRLRDQGLNTDNAHGNRMKRKSSRQIFAVSHIVEILPEAPNEILATENEDGPDFNQIMQASRQTKLDPRKTQMLRRNISVNRRASKMIKQMRDNAISGVSGSSRRGSIERQSKSQPAGGMRCQSGGLNDSQFNHSVGLASVLDSDTPAQVAPMMSMYPSARGGTACQNYSKFQNIENYCNSWIATGEQNMGVRQRPHTQFGNYPELIEGGQFDISGRRNGVDHALHAFPRQEDSSTINQESLYNPQQSLQQHLMTPKIIGSISQQHSMQNTAQNFFNPQAPISSTANEGPLQGIPIKSRANIHLPVSVPEQAYTPGDLLMSEAGSRPMTQQNALIDQSYTHGGRSTAELYGRRRLRMHSVAIWDGSSQQGLNQQPVTRMLHARQQMASHSKNKSSSGANSSAFGRCVTAATSQQNSGKKSLWRSADLKNSGSKLSGLLMIQSTKQILPQITNIDIRGRPNTTAHRM